MKQVLKFLPLALISLLVVSCATKKKKDQSANKLQSIDLLRGDIALCSSGEGQFGTVEFSLSCSEKVKANFNLATALLHSFEYVEAEKAFAKVIDEDPNCAMAYWGAAMCSFHPLWSPPSREDLEKGSRIISVARSLEKSERESDYLEAIACIYDHWDKFDHRSRADKFEKATEKIYEKYPGDKEAAIFYALALRATADPTDKSFAKQKKAGKILINIFASEPNHPGIAHYIIHTYDYPELAELALPAARKYASIAAASAHAQHMPSHIFTRLGLWEESVKSNLNSISAAQCYAQNLGIKGHWDEELHGMDYLVYAYLQQGQDDKASKQLEYLKTIGQVSPLNFKGAYTFASIPARCALEQKHWQEAAQLELFPTNFPWQDFPWEKAIIHFGRILGAVHINKLEEAKNELLQLHSIYDLLHENSEKNYEANQVLIQIKASEGWIQFAEGKKTEAVKLMTAAADMEDATEKHPVTPGEVIPARELLGDMYSEMNLPGKAVDGLFGAGLAERKLGNKRSATSYFKQLLDITNFPESKRAELAVAQSFLKNNN